MSNEDRNELERELKMGELSARDEGNIAERADEHAVTSLTSPWLYESCHACAHTFRLGDTVRRRETGDLVHDGPDLRCSAASERFAPANLDEVREFFGGLDAAWP